MNDDKKHQIEKVKKVTSKAAKLRMLLVLFFALVVAGGAYAYYVSLEELKSYASLVNTKVIDSEASANQVQQLQSLESQVSSQNNLIAKADQIFATQGNFQTQAVRDVRHYAQLAGLTVTNTTFSDEPATSPTGRTFTVNLQSPAPYGGLIRFLKGIENNIPKMEVTNLKVSRASSTDGNNVNLDNVTMIIHVK